MGQKKRKSENSFFSKVKAMMKDVRFICESLAAIATLILLIKQIFH